MRLPTWTPLAIAIVAYVALFTFYCWRRWASFAEGDYDLGINEQGYWTAARYGMPFFNTYENRSHFAFHWSPSYYLLLPAYALWPGAPTLLFLQTVALALGAVPVWLLARDLLGPRSALAFALLYLGYMPLHGVNYHDWHEVCMIVAPAMLALWGLCTGRRGPLWIGAVLTLCGREDMGLVVALTGGLLAWMSRTPSSEGMRPLPARHGVMLAVLGLAWTMVSYLWIMPAFGEAPDHFGDRLGHLADSKLLLPLAPILEPAAFWGQLLGPPTLSYLAGLLAPLAFLPLWAPLLLVPALPVLLVNVLSSFGGMHLFSSHYAGPLIPFMFAAAVMGLRRIALARLSGREVVAPGHLDHAALRRLRPAFVLTVLVVLAFDPSPLHVGRVPRPVDEHSRARASLVASIPEEVSVSTQVNLWTRLARRRQAYLGYREGVDLVIVDERYPQYAREVGLDAEVPRLLQDGRYALEREVDGVKVYRRSTR